MDDYEEAVLLTLCLLESRLDRLEYILGGSQAPTDAKTKTKTVQERVQKIERGLQGLATKTTLLSDAQELCKHPACPLTTDRSDLTRFAVSKHKDVLKPTDDSAGTGLDSEQKAVVVVDRAPGFASTASQLKALDDQPIPQTDGFVKLARLAPRIAEAEDRHLRQALEISLLRKKSGLLVQRAKHVQLLGPNRCWLDWDKRLQNAQRSVARIEFRRKQEQEDGL